MPGARVNRHQRAFDNRLKIKRGFHGLIFRVNLFDFDENNIIGNDQFLRRPACPFIALFLDDAGEIAQRNRNRAARDIADDGMQQFPFFRRLPPFQFAEIREPFLAFFRRIVAVIELKAVASLQIAQMALHLLLSDVLHPQIKRRIDFQAFLIHPRAVLILQILPDVFDEIRGFVDLAFRQFLLFKRFFEGDLCLFLRNIAFRDHAIQHVLLPFFRLFRVADRRMRGRPLQNSGEHGAFAEIKLLNLFAEIGFCGGAQAIRAVSPIILIRVQFEDLLLRVLFAWQQFPVFLLDFEG